MDGSRHHPQRSPLITALYINPPPLSSSTNEHDDKESNSSRLRTPFSCFNVSVAVQLKMDMRDQYGNLVGQTDEYGNPLRTDAYGNPLPSTRHEGYGHGVEAGGYGAAGGQPQMMHPSGAEHKHGIDTGGHGAAAGGMLHRSGSSSSSSSEDDGMGGRRKKKGLKEKLKEKLPGGHGSAAEQQQHGQYQEQHEKKGVMEKIKEKLPGHHHQ